MEIDACLWQPDWNLAGKPDIRHEIAAAHSVRPPADPARFVSLSMRRSQSHAPSFPRSTQSERMSPKPIPSPSFLDKCEYLGAFSGVKRWRSYDRRQLYTWDSLHGEVEAFNKRGRHIGVLDPISGDLIKDAVRGRRIDV